MLPVRDAADLLGLVEERAVVPEVAESWFLFDSILNRADIILEAREKHPGSEVAFYRWMTPEFVASDFPAFFSMDEDRAGYLVEYNRTNDLFTRPENELTERYITGRFG